MDVFTPSLSLFSCTSK